MCMSRSVIGLRGGAELLSKLALLSLTGLKQTVYVKFFSLLTKPEIKLSLQLSTQMLVLCRRLIWLQYMSMRGHKHTVPSIGHSLGDLGR